MRRLVSFIILGLLAGLLAGCTGPRYADTPLPPPVSSVPSADKPGGPPQAPPTCDTNPLASYDPVKSLPKPGAMPAGSTMAAIAKRGRLIVGVSADTYLMGARNPATGEIEGFDIDVVKSMAQAILGDKNAYELRVITAADRIPLLKNRAVDMVARNLSITCQRWSEIAFSAEYYRSGQKVLVRDGSPIKSATDLDGVKVCAPEATSSIGLLRKELPGAIAVGSNTHTECLILFQRGEVDAITGDDTVLAGLARQDPYAKVLAMKPLSQEPYGLGFNAEDVDLVRFANAVLAKRVADGEWKASYDRWLAEPLGGDVSPPKPVYGRKP